MPAKKSVLRLVEKSCRREVSAISRQRQSLVQNLEAGSTTQICAPVVGVNTVEHKEIAVRRDARAGVSSNSVESFAKMYSSQNEIAEVKVSENISCRSSKVLQQENRADKTYKPLSALYTLETRSNNGLSQQIGREVPANLDYYLAGP